MASDSSVVTEEGLSGGRPLLRSAASVRSPRLSVIVPNYNHEKFLRTRLDSIYHQTFRDYEVILLDDASTDGSVEILREYERAYPANTRLFVNKTNSGGPFHQWAQGIERARGDLIWIAESDDLCQPDFLERIIPAFEKDSVLLGYGDIQYIDEVGAHRPELYNYRKSTGYDIWNASYREPAPVQFSGPFGIKNIIANVSARFSDAPSLSADFVQYLWRLQGLRGLDLLHTRGARRRNLLYARGESVFSTAPQQYVG
jgi:glycosyltransferase involved in cell wall biosynthesis